MDQEAMIIDHTVHIDGDGLRRHIASVEDELSHINPVSDKERFKKLSREHSYLQDIFAVYVRLEEVKKQLLENQELMKCEKDPEIIELVKAEEEALSQEKELLERKISDLIIPPSDDDDQTTIMEIRAGTGGQEAALFAAECVRMYQMYATKRGWKFEGLSATPSDLGGFKEYIMAVSGKGVWRTLQHEGGTHRVQRVPETEAQGRVHTSTITVAVLQEADEDASSITINEQDIRMETTRSSGAGGQHVNKTDSAVRLTHIPTGVVVFCQEERSQHKNKDKAMRILRAKIIEIERKRLKSEEDAIRLEQVGSGDRSEKIRTYNFPQNRITDHRIELTKYNLDQVMHGDLQDFSSQLIAHYQKERGKASPFPWISV